MLCIKQKNFFGPCRSSLWDRPLRRTLVLYRHCEASEAICELHYNLSE